MHLEYRETLHSTRAVSFSMAELLLVDMLSPVITSPPLGTDSTQSTPIQQFDSILADASSSRISPSDLAPDTGHDEANQKSRRPEKEMGGRGRPKGSWQQRHERDPWDQSCTSTVPRAWRSTCNMMSTSSRARQGCHSGSSEGQEAERTSLPPSGRYPLCCCSIASYSILWHFAGQDEWVTCMRHLARVKVELSCICIADFLYKNRFPCTCILVFALRSFSH